MTRLLLAVAAVFALLLAGTAPATAAGGTFRSPAGGGIECAIGGVDATCYSDQTLDRPFGAPAGRSCGSDSSAATVAANGRPRWTEVCNPFFATRSLAVGRTIGVGKLACRSLRTGVKCWSRATKRGFVITPARVRFL